MRIRLEQLFGAHAGRLLEFDQDAIRMGRMPDSDVAFDAEADLDASGRHAEVRRGPDGFVVVDCQSRNGTFVNGRRVDRAVLKHGDEIECGVGGPRLRVHLDGGDGPVDVDPRAATIMAPLPELRPSELPPTIAPPDPAQLQSPKVPRPAPLPRTSTSDGALSRPLMWGIAGVLVVGVGLVLGWLFSG